MGRVANTTRTGTSTWYGYRNTGGKTGVLKTEGAQNELMFDFTGQTLNDLVFDPTYVPAGAVITKAYIRVTEAFDLQGSSVLKIGTSTTEATNGASVTEAQLEATGYVDLTSTLAGTWDAEVPLAVKALVSAAFSAGGLTSGTGKGVGKARFVVEFTKVA